jgi:hypothetical protein
VKVMLITVPNVLQVEVENQNVDVQLWNMTSVIQIVKNVTGDVQIVMIILEIVTLVVLTELVIFVIVHSILKWSMKSTIKPFAHLVVANVLLVSKMLPTVPPVKTEDLVSQIVVVMMVFMMMLANV